LYTAFCTGEPGAAGTAGEFADSCRERETVEGAAIDKSPSTGNSMPGRCRSRIPVDHPRSIADVAGGADDNVVGR
jgi:hypothetical protein